MDLSLQGRSTSLNWAKKRMIRLKLSDNLNKILKRILMIPKGTPNEPVYIDRHKTGAGGTYPQVTKNCYWPVWPLAKAYSV